MIKTILTGVLLVALISCESSTPSNQKNKVNVAENTDLNIEFEKFELDNGLEVVFHIDRSDPVVAVALTAHVGSAREKEGRTGFAHLFEHLLFLESENLGKGGLDKMSARIGGSGANGSTSRDRTNYFQTVPKDALEKMIWAEADKLGWFINTVTEPVLAKEKQVVKNEKRQRVDNRPYGHTRYVIDKNLYPKDHPYNWQVIGSLEDLQNATLADVKEFFRRWYVPNNVTLVISGDFDTSTAKQWIRKYFDEIPRGETITPLTKRSAVVQNTKKLYHEDNFAKVPQLTMVWPTVAQYTKDAYALDVLSEYLSSGKSAPLYKALVEQEKLTSRVSMFNTTSELAGQLQLSVTAFSGKSLDDIETVIHKTLAEFETNGIPESNLNRIKAGQETDFYNSLSSVLGKGFQLAQYNIFANDPGFINKDIKNILSVTPTDVMRVYNKYVKGKNFIATSFVPKGQLDLALSESIKAEVVEEKITEDSEATFDASITAKYERTPSSFDRTKEPDYGKTPTVTIPTVWKDKLSNGLELYGIENTEVPLVQFDIVIDGGQLLEDFNKTGVTNLLANIMTKGTANKTPQALEEAIQQLGASINVFADKDNITITANMLAKNYNETLKLLEEILLEPRWDIDEFKLAQQSASNQLLQLQANPNAIANDAYNQLVYGKDNIKSKSILGNLQTINTITIEDLKAYYNKNISPSVAKMHIVGAIPQQDVVSSLKTINESWTAKNVTIPTYKTAERPKASKIYFYDVPEAKQSVLNIGYPALAVTDTDYYPATIMNYILGGGGFASKLTQQLRDEKGYTYGINSRFSGSKDEGLFTISSGVRTNVTLESAQLIKDILSNFGKDYSKENLATTKQFLIKSNARAFETANAKLRMLRDMSTFGFDANYVKERETIVNNMTIEAIKTLSEKYLNPNTMNWLIVGDAKTQLKRLKELGYGDPILLNTEVKK